MANGERPARRGKTAWLSSQRSIQASGAILVVISAALFVALAVSNWRATVDDAERVAQTLTSMLAENASRTVDLSTEVAEYAIATVAERDWDEIAASKQVFAALRQICDRYEYLNSIVLVDESGEVRLATNSFPTPAASVALRDYFTAQQEKDAGLQVSPVLKSRAGEGRNIVISRRINGQDGTFRGAVLVILSPDYFEHVYRDVRVNYPVEVELFKNFPLLLARFPVPAEEGDRANIDDAWLKSSPVRGMVDTTWPADQGHRVVAFEAVRRSPLYVSVAIGYDDISARWLASEIQKSIFAAAALGIILFFVSIAAIRCGHEGDARAEIEALNQTLEDRVKERTATVERLMAELNHRVKNSLQMIAGMLNMQARGASRPDVRLQLAEARSRVMMIARIHARLEHKDGRSSVRLDHLLQDVANDLSKTLNTVEGVPIGLNVDAAAVEVSVEKAAPIVLVTNELITNAVKHSFPQGRTGNVWATLQPSDPGYLELCVEDDGVGLPAGFQPSASTGLGMSLIVGLTHQLSGTLTHGASVHGGARFAIVFPLADPEERAADTAEPGA